MIYTRIGSKATIHQSLNTLEDIGLIQRGKTNRGNNIYVVYKPLSKNELSRLFPDNAKKLKADEEKLMNMNEYDKERYHLHQLNKQVQQQQIQAKQVIPKVETINYEELENLSLKELKMFLKERGEM
ncbi:hypothetical protein ACTFQN_19360 [Bacillus cereus group sp. MYBK30-1]|uniref:hypothetical protein n=1 Tax=unclassified Bacillus cereus group TaxID=2750818 RepID=UPI003F7A9724